MAGTVLVHFNPATLSRYTSGFMVKFFALSIHSPLFTASKKPNHASLASHIVNGQ
jgi:hypothetical protein